MCVFIFHFLSHKQEVIIHLTRPLWRLNAKIPRSSSVFSRRKSGRNHSLGALSTCSHSHPNLKTLPSKMARTYWKKKKVAVEKEKQLTERRGEKAPPCIGRPLPIYPLWLELIKHLSQPSPQKISHPHFVTLIVGCSLFPTCCHSQKLLGVYSPGTWQGMMQGPH